MNFIHVDYLVPVMVCGHHLVLCDPWYNTFPYLWFPANLGVGGCSSQYTRFHQSLFWCFCGVFFWSTLGSRGWTWYSCISFSQNHSEGSKQSLLLVLFFICLFFQMLQYLLLGGGGGGLFSKAEMRFQVLGCLTQRRKTPTFKLQCSTRNIHI